MAGLVGMSATNAHIFLMMEGWHQLSSRLNSSVIFNVYCRGGESVALLIDVSTHDVAWVV